MTKLIQTANCYEMNHRLTYYECTDSGHPSMSMLLSMMTMVSDYHSSFVGLDRPKIEASGGAWVIIGYEGHLAKKQPVFGDQVILGTRAIAYNRFFAFREFWMTDADHQHEYARVKSMFVMMNLKQRRLMRIPDGLIKPFNSPKKNRLPRLTVPDKLPAEFASKDYRVRYFDIDINHHVNNARYFDWLLDPLGPDFLREHAPAAFAIKYESEVREGAKVASRYQLSPADTDGQLTSKHEIWSNHQRCTSAEFKWRPIGK